MAGDLVTAAHSRPRPRSLSPAPPGGRRRSAPSVVAAVAHQRQRRDPRRPRVAGVIRDRRERQQRLAGAGEALPDRLRVQPEPAPATFAALVRDVGVQRANWRPGGSARSSCGGRPRPAFLPCLCRCPSPAARSDRRIHSAIGVRRRPASAGACVPEHPRHRQLRVVVDDAPRHATEVAERGGVPRRTPPSSRPETPAQTRRRGAGDRRPGRAPCIRRQRSRPALSPKSAWASPGGWASGTNISCAQRSARTEAFHRVAARDPYSARQRSTLRVAVCRCFSAGTDPRGGDQ